LRKKAHIVPSIATEIATVKPHAEREKYVVWAATLRKPKRPDVLIEIARRLPSVRFVVCGGPSSFASPPGYTESIVNELRSQSNIDFLGQTTSAQTRQLISDASIVLSTSDAEGFPNTFLEAWSSGTPVISLRVDPDNAICKHGLGMVPGSVEQVVLEIVSLLNSPHRREAIAAKARRYVLSAHGEAAATLAFERAIAADGLARIA
jgi:glycosyltransferase involved in cell wall biosynthesis